jgi:hypothetical protein
MDFLSSTNFELSSKIKGNLITNCDFLGSKFLLQVAIAVTCHGHQKPSYATVRNTGVLQQLVLTYVFL